MLSLMMFKSKLKKVNGNLPSFVRHLSEHDVLVTIVSKYLFIACEVARSLPYRLSRLVSSVKLQLDKQGVSSVDEGGTVGTNFVLDITVFTMNFHSLCEL